MPRLKTANTKPDASPPKRDGVFCLPGAPGGDFVREFIMSSPPPPPPWGPLMEQEIRDRLTADGFTVTLCRCLEEHPVVQLRMRGPALTDQEVRKRIRKLAKDLGHRAPPGGMAITGRAGKFDGAFVMEAEFGTFQPCSEILP